MINNNGKNPEGEGRYIYCVVETDRKKIFKNFGVDGEDVYTIRYRDISAVVSRCLAKPYQSNDSELVKKWLIQHAQVVDYFFERYDATLPSAFDTVIKGGDQEAKSWLKGEYSALKGKMEKVRGKQEFGAQIFCDSKSLVDAVRKGSVEIHKMLNEIESKPRGLAYMYEQKLKEVMKKELENKMEKYARDFYEAIRSHVDDLKAEKIKKGEGDQQMLMNLSCLTPKDRVPELAGELDRINGLRNFSVKFTGPWPAYSFMA
ncbi:MAG: GvpL/GvpF family gas vesicle protein [Candidatus Bathyarchaeota archaeon]